MLCTRVAASYQRFSYHTKTLEVPLKVKTNLERFSVSIEVLCDEYEKKNYRYRIKLQQKYPPSNWEGSQTLTSLYQTNNLHCVTRRFLCLLM